MLDKYLNQYSTLKTDRNRNRWTGATCGRAPHKPFLLLSIMDLIAQGLIARNFIEPSLELVETWNGYWNLIMPFGQSSSMAYPFYHMRSEPFWSLIPNPGREDLPGRTFSSMSRVREVYAGAMMDEGLFAFLLNNQTREKLRAVLVETYFAADIRPAICEHGLINYGAEIYKRKVLQEAKEELAWFQSQSDPARDKKVRDQGFRKAIVKLYEHRCALCGIRILTPEGHTVVEAAHIVPWSKSRDDHPTNGLCLCRLCHWFFDEGLMSVGLDYEVLVSRKARGDRNLLGHILTLSDRPIFKPEAELYHPAQRNLEAHRRQTFIR